MKKEILKKIFLNSSIVAKNNKDYQKFIILSSPRTGSTWLSSLLRSHKNLIVFNELFHRKNIGWIGLGDYVDKTKEVFKYRDMRPLDFLQDIIFGNYNEKIEAVGFKIHGNCQPARNATVVWSYLASLSKLKVIQIKRNNFLEQFTSLQIAQKTNIWQIKSKLKKLETPRLRLNFIDCLKFFNELEITNNFFSKIFKKSQVYEVSYEGLCQNSSKEIYDMQNFLDLTIKNLHSPYKKINQYPLNEIIINYKELKNKFRKTKWIRFFKY